MISVFDRLWQSFQTRKSARPEAIPTGQLMPLAESLLPPLVVEAERIGHQIRTGVHHQHRAGTGEDFWQYRPAHSMEPAHRIDWRQSARSNQLWVREREAEGAQQVAFWSDPSPSMDWRSRNDLPSKLQQAHLCTLALASAVLSGGERVNLINGPEPSRSVSGTHALPGLARSLLSGSAPTLPTLDVLRPYGHLILISDFLLPLEAIEQMLRQAAGRPARTSLLCILDPAERALPYAGRVRFESAEDAQGLTLPATETLATPYEQAMSAHLDALTALAQSAHASLTLHSTNQPVLPTLMSLFARLSGERLHA